MFSHSSNKWFLLAGFILVALAIWFKPQAETQMLSLDIKDRENGICSTMYFEGYDWGLQQFPMQFGLWEDEDERFAEHGVTRSKAFKAERFYDYMADYISHS